MSDTDSTATIETTHPNADLATGLREAADWLEQHPELPSADYATINFGYGIDVNARERLTQLAAALGDRATERVSDYGTSMVHIEGNFGSMLRVSASAHATSLVEVPPVPEHEPIIPVDEYQDDPLSVFS